ncbi:MAG: hypothetical protein GY861_04170, partial [bacterium]|nr:hypothetical protein [bacterium]
MPAPLPLTVLQKIQNCRASIKASNLTKAGRNKFSEYDYYTPEQVDKLVYDACLSEKLFCKFSMIRDEHGITGWLKVIDLESGESETFQMATEIPVIKATNATQQMGGAMTYTNRYLLMSVFDIVENALDPDSQKPPKKEKPFEGHPLVTPSATTKKEDTKPWLNEDMPAFQKAKDAIASGGKTIKDVRKVYKVNRKVAALLET